MHTSLAAKLRRIYKRYHSPRFLGLDPLVCVQGLEGPREREAGGLIAASLSYGRVESIIASIRSIIAFSGGRLLPYIAGTSYAQKKKDLRGFRHRFNGGGDIALLMETVRAVCSEYGTLEELFRRGIRKHDTNIRYALSAFIARLRLTALTIDPHPSGGFFYLLSSPDNGSACKRMNMFLRWMVRKNDGVDLGVWCKVPCSLLVMPVDTHIARAARSLGLTRRKTPDWVMAEEITGELKKVDPRDPVKYDFSLCRYGMLLFRKGYRR